MKLLKRTCANCCHLTRTHYCRYYDLKIAEWALYTDKKNNCSFYAETPQGILRIWERVFKLNNYD